jgi:hypothetical protein
MRQTVEHEAAADNEAVRGTAGPTAMPGGWRGATPAGPEMLSALQGAAGNRAVAGLMQPDSLVITDDLVPDPGLPAPDLTTPVAVGFVDGGMAGTVPFGDSTGTLDLNCPHAFVDGGMTGTVVWSGGGGAGAHGNEGVGSIQTQIPPTYAATAGPTAGKFSSTIAAGTGVLSVTRSWIGAFAGDQGNGWYLTAAAVTKVNNHERNHVASTRGLYAAHLTPLELRIANPALGVDAGATAAAAIAAHRTAINWVPSISAFQTADTAANKPGGTIDAADVAAGWIVDRGPGTVAGTAFTHRVTDSGEAAPAP